MQPFIAATVYDLISYNQTAIMIIIITINNKEKKKKIIIIVCKLSDT